MLLHRRLNNAAAYAPAGGGGGPSRIMGYTKPTGTPSYMASSDLPGMLFVAYDTGSGSYCIPLDCSPGHAFDPPTTNGFTFEPATLVSPHSFSVPNYNASSTATGTAQQWSGALDSTTPGGGALVPVQSSDALRTAVDLVNAGTGAAFTMYASFIQTSARTGDVDLICGRGQDLDNDYFNGALLTFSQGLVFRWCSDPIGGASDNGASLSDLQLYYAGPYSLNVLHTVVVSCVNTSSSPGVTTITMYLDGTQVAQVTGKTVCDVSHSNSFSEDQLQVGTAFHVSGGQQFNSFDGYVPVWGIATSVWDATAAASLTANPYQMLAI